jgi:molybdopterin adenylyltransferase
MPEHGRIVSVNISDRRGVVKTPVAEVAIDSQGIVGDSHASDWHRQLSLLDIESIQRFNSENETGFEPGAFAENITTQGIDLDTVGLLDRFVVNDVELEVTQIGKACHGRDCAVARQTSRCIMPQHGIFCRVVRGGGIKGGDEISHQKKPLKTRIITLSDRASRGEYEDRSGAEIHRILTDFFSTGRWHSRITSVLIPDDSEMLRRELIRCEGAGDDLLITTGGTGVSPADITPETVSAFCDKLIPGVMENIRMKFGIENPNARLSRGIAGVKSTCQVYTLPGSVRAVKQYMPEILETFEHIFQTLHGIEPH